MSEKELDDLGLFLPPDTWEENEPHANMSIPILLLIGFIGVFSSLLMYIGDGHFVSIIGMVIFIANLFLFTLYGMKAINKQNEHLRKMMKR